MTDLTHHTSPAAPMVSATDLDFVLNRFVEDTEGVRFAQTVSADGMHLAASAGSDSARHDTFAAIWGSPFVVDGKVLVGTTDGEVVVLGHGKELKELAANDVRSTIYTTPVVANGVLYVSTRNQLVAIEAR